jgi:hypothetical protein
MRLGYVLPRKYKSMRCMISEGIMRELAGSVQRSAVGAGKGGIICRIIPWFRRVLKLITRFHGRDDPSETSLRDA